MPQAIVDPEELRQFARALKRFNQELRDQTMQLGSRLAALSATWRDQEHRKFVESFERQLLALEQFQQAVDQYIPFLLRKASHIDDYLQSS